MFVLRLFVSQGTDSTLLQKMNKIHSGNKIYVASKHRLETVFGIRHFAGVVYYDSTGTKKENLGEAGRLKASAVN